MTQNELQELIEKLQKFQEEHLFHTFTDEEANEKIEEAIGVINSVWIVNNNHTDTL